MRGENAMIIGTVISSILTMGILILIGGILARKEIITIEVERAFSYILLKIAIPALVISAFNIDYSPEKLKMGMNVLIIGFVYTLLTIVINHLLSKRVKNRGKRKIMSYAGALTNCGFMGLPVVYQIFGYEGAFLASMFYIAIIFYTWTYGMSVFFDKIGRQELKQMLLNANMISVYIGLLIFVFSIDIPLLGERIIETIGGITTPLAMFIIGARIGRVRLIELFNDKLIYVSTFLKLIFYPLIMMAFLTIVDFDPVVEGVCLIYSSLPPPAITVVIANQFNCEVEFASKIIVMTHVVSLVTIPLMFAIFELI
jgi:hypothetical protein